MKKDKKITVSTDMETYKIWLSVSNNLIKSKAFRSKSEIIESVIYFLEKATPEEIYKIRTSSILDFK